MSRMKKADMLMMIDECNSKHAAKAQRAGLASETFLTRNGHNMTGNRATFHLWKFALIPTDESRETQSIREAIRLKG